jgi:hypothetical protein
VWYERLRRGGDFFMPVNVSKDEFDTRFAELESEVDGEKLVTRHVLEETRRNSDDLAAIKRRLDRVEGRLDQVERKLDGVDRKVDHLSREFRGFPTVVGEIMREVLKRD